MKRFSIYLVTFLIAVSLLMGMCACANAYDKKIPTNDIPTMAQYYTYVKIKTIGIAEGLYVGNDCKYHSRKTPFELNGSGFVYKSGFILTAAHVIEPYVVETIESGVSSRVAEPVYVHDRTIFVYDYRDNPTIATLYHMDLEHDIALLVFPRYGVLQPMPYDSINGDRTLLEVGDVVCVVVRGRDGWEMTNDIELKYGTVVATEPIITGGNVSWFNPYDITIDIRIWPGDSGSPLFVFRDGKPVLVGIVRAIHEDWISRVYYAYAVTIPKVDRYIEAWRNK